MSRVLINESIDAGDVKAINDYLVVKVLEREKTQGGIIVVQGKDQRVYCIGKVLSSGGRILNQYDGHDWEQPVKVGDLILFMDYAGERMSVAWEHYRILHEHGIWATVKIKDKTTEEIESIVPYADRLLVECVNETKTKTGNLYLVNGQQGSAMLMGTVVASGRGMLHCRTRELVPNECQPGDKILFRRYAGADIMVNGKQYRLVQEVDVFTKVED